MRKVRRTDRDRSIDELEGRRIRRPYPTGMIKRVVRARAKPLRKLSAEDLRLLLGQEDALEYTIPLAIEVLERIDSRLGTCTWGPSSSPCIERSQCTS